MNCIHEGHISEYRISAQGLFYPKRAEEGQFRIRYNMTMSESVFDRKLVKRLMSEQGITQTDMAKLVGLPSQSAMSNILKGLRGVSADEASVIYKFLGLPLDQRGEVQEIPIIGFTSAGGWREAVELPIATMSIPRGRAGKRSFAVQVEGDSMDRIVADGDYVVIDPDQKELVPGKCYLLQNGEHEVTLKCYQREPARFVPLSNNPTHQPFLVSEHDFVILGRAVWKGGSI
jgi:repressor LexA